MQGNIDKNVLRESIRAYDLINGIKQEKNNINLNHSTHGALEISQKKYKLLNGIEMPQLRDKEMDERNVLWLC